MKSHELNRKVVDREWVMAYKTLIYARGHIFKTNPCSSLCSEIQNPEIFYLRSLDKLRNINCTIVLPLLYTTTIV